MLEFLGLLLDPLLDGIVERPVVGIFVLALLVYWTSFVLTGCPASAGNGESVLPLR
jgi:hypothetical protein